MKYGVAAAALVAAMVSTAAAQQSQSPVVPPAGSTPTANYLWVAVRGANVVDVRQTNGTLILTLAGPPFNFNQPWDIVGVPSLHKVFVSNRGAVPGTITVIDTESLQFVGTIQVPGSQELRGMSVSEDESRVLVAGQDPGGPAVYGFDPGSLAAAVRVGLLAVPGRGAEDCVVIRDANAGGSGAGPGKVFFSVRQPGVAGMIGIADLIGGGTTFVTTGAGALASVELPDSMERTVDSRFVFIGCSKITGFAPDARVIIVNPVTNAASAAVVAASSQDLATNRVFDVTWALGSSGNNRGFVLAQFPPSATRNIIEIDETGAQVVVPVQGDINGLTPVTLRYSALTEQVFLGENFGTANRYNFFNAKNPPPVNTGTTILTGADSLNFAVMATPLVKITDIVPRAGPAQASFIVTVYGSGFQPGCTVGLGAAAVPIAGFIDSNTILVNLGGAAPGTLTLQINSPNLQFGLMDSFYRRHAAAPATPNFTLNLPGLAGGYRMFSVPQYATLTQFRNAMTVQLGAYNPLNYRVFFYRNGAYIELNAMVDDGCDLAGESFWIITRSPATFVLNAPDVLQNAGGTNRVIPIPPGFSMISQPNFQGGGALNWAQVQVTDDPSDLTTAQGVTTPFGQSIVGPAALEYSGGGYVTADPLVAGRGYWIQNITTQPAYLVFNPALVTKPGPPGGASGAGGSPPPAGMNPPSPPSGIGATGSGGGGGCGFVGLEWILIGLARAAFRRGRGVRRLGA